MDEAAARPTFDRVALAGTFQLGPRTATLQISPIQQFPDYGPHHDVVHLQVLVDGEPLALADLSARLAPARCYALWSDLCAALQAAVVDAYALTPGESGESNPRLGCWGPRPDLLGQGESDCNTALLIGLAIDRREAARRPTSVQLAQRLATALLGALRGWERAAAEA